MSELEKNYRFEDEMKWYELWEKKGFFKPEVNPDGEAYSIVIPPPNVTGSLHMGHALNATLQDILIRWKRMHGYRALWLPGTDHAGIATQNVVERELAKEGIDRFTLGRKEFIRKVWQWKEDYGERIINQLKRLGASCDWSRQRFTLDEGLSEAVREVFVRLFQDGLIYRDLRLINWCPRCHTALSDLEVEHEDLEGKLIYIRYPLTDDSGYIVVATTRPETMPGDSAVAVHPEDGRYKDFTGKRIKLPLTRREIPIIADEMVDPRFGTGAVKVTPAHDFNDEAMARRQTPNLPFITVIAEDGTMTDTAGKKYAGLDRYECRKKVIEDLKELDLVEKEQKHVHSVGHCYRCKTIIEPFSTVQWYVNVKELAEDAIKAVRDERIQIIPEGWANSYYAWMENIRDWCISRQIWWGHQIPVWYCPYCRTEEGQHHGDLIYISFHKPLNVGGDSVQAGTYTELRLRGLAPEDIMKNANTVKIDKSVTPICSRQDPGECPYCGSKELLRDPDVLDTWFSSALWPFSTLGWPEKTEDLETFYPTNVLITGFDILFFWVARMIMMGLKFMDDVPFRDVYIHALVRDMKGQKMSKSKGNVIDPLILIDKYGADAFRFTLTAFAAQGRDIKFSEERVEGYKNFINKLWNASRFINTNIAGEEALPSNGNNWQEDLDAPGRWILSRLAKTSDDINTALTEYRFNDAATAIYQFIWHEFCDWYIELSKPVIYNNTSHDASRRATLKCLLYILESSLRLLHPFMPFVTEEVWQTIPHKGDSIMLSPFPHYKERDIEAEEKMSYIMEAIAGIRTIRGELNIPPSLELFVLVRPYNKEIEEILAGNSLYISKLAKTRELSIGTDVTKGKGVATSVRDHLEVYVPLEGLLNVDAEIKRLRKDMQKVDQSISSLDRKLLNEDFIRKAPRNVVEKEKIKYNEFMQKKERIIESINKLQELRGKDNE
ncbi:Valyl-tRNA synthetase [hydrothermal vent metagenome]|uniref:valine--tRNA ligase n=1 Tax=hydrothermal vent metagenome TaxID=652676 RepID=A0A3B1D5M2_9ZZZZ